LNSIVAEDEAWCFRYDPITKRQNAEWKSSSSPKGKKVRLQKSKVKTMLVCFYDSKGIIHHEFVPEVQTGTGSFYLCVMECLWRRIRRDRLHSGGSNMAACAGVIRDSVISVGTSSDVTEMTLQQTTLAPRKGGGGGNEVVVSRGNDVMSFERKFRRCQAIKEK